LFMVEAGQLGNLEVRLKLPVRVRASFGRNFWCSLDSRQPNPTHSNIGRILPNLYVHRRFSNQ
jgi:hypothetical protein